MSVCRTYLRANWHLMLMYLQNNTMQCNAVQCSSLQCSAVQCNATQRNATQHNTTTTQHDTTQHNTIQNALFKVAKNRHFPRASIQLGVETVHRKCNKMCTGRGHIHIKRGNLIQFNEMNTILDTTFSPIKWKVDLKAWSSNFDTSVILSGWSFHDNVLI